MSDMNGLGDLGAGYEMDAYAPIDGLAEDYEFFGLGGMADVLSMENLQRGGIALAAGAGGILITANVLDRIEYFADPANMKLRYAAEAAVAIVGGGLLYAANPAAGIGWAGGVGGAALAHIIAGYIAEMDTGNGNGDTTTEGMGYTEVHNQPPYMRAGAVSVPRGWGHGRAPLGRDLVTQANYRQIAGADELADVEELSTWIGG